MKFPKKIFTIPFLLAVYTCSFSQNPQKMSPIKMQFQSTGEGKDLVLVPGGLTGWASWNAFVPDFAANHRVIQVQLLSVQYGLENRDLPFDYSIKMESEALALSLKEMEITTPTDFIAWSFGAFVLLDFSLNYPELVNSIVLIEPPAFWILNHNNNIGEDTQRIMEFLNTLQGEISEDQLEEFMTTVGFAPPGTSLKQHPLWENWLKFRRSLRNSKHVVAHDDDYQRLSTMDKKVLLVKGTGSAGFLHEIIDHLHKELPGSRIIELPEGHAPHIVSKNEFLNEYRNFISEQAK